MGSKAIPPKNSVKRLAFWKEVFSNSPSSSSTIPQTVHVRGECQIFSSIINPVYILGISVYHHISFKGLLGGLNN